MSKTSKESLHRDRDADEWRPPGEVDGDFEVKREAHSEHVANLARLMLFHANTRRLVPRTDVTGSMFMRGKAKLKCAADRAVSDAKEMLHDCGIMLIEVPQLKTACSCGEAAGGPRRYMLLSGLTAEEQKAVGPPEPGEMCRRGLLMIVLSLLLCNNDAMTEVELWGCLGRMGLPEGMRHPVLGPMDHRVFASFVAEGYLRRFKAQKGAAAAVVGVAGGEQGTSGWRFDWGPRAVFEILPDDVHRFVVDVMGERPRADVLVDRIRQLYELGECDGGPSDAIGVETEPSLAAGGDAAEECTRPTP